MIKETKYLLALFIVLFVGTIARYIWQKKIYIYIQSPRILNHSHPPSVHKHITELYHFFFPIWVFFHEHSRLAGQQGKWEAISLTPLYHFHPGDYISWAITEESSPLHIASSRTQNGNLWFPSASHWSLSCNSGDSLQLGWSLYVSMHSCIYEELSFF